MCGEVKEQPQSYEDQPGGEQADCRDHRSSGRKVGWDSSRSKQY